MKTMTVDELMQKFLDDLRRYAEPALYSSFRKYAQRRDELIGMYVKSTGVPEDEFHHAIAMKLAQDLG